eukprot:3461184-Pyramimonas_sp.AAC.1
MFCQPDADVAGERQPDDEDDCGHRRQGRVRRRLRRCSQDHDGQADVRADVGGARTAGPSPASAALLDRHGRHAGRCAHQRRDRQGAAREAGFPERVAAERAAACGVRRAQCALTPCRLARRRA